MTPIEKDPHFQGCYELADLSEQNGLQSTFYFMAARPDLLDDGYDPLATPAQQLIRDLRQRGHEMGFHPGYSTLNNPKRFMEEKRRMDIALGGQQYGGRQHFLRFRVPHTWRLWEEAGLTYSSTLGYADHEGFRCGTCHPYRPFDVERDRQFDLVEIPLVAMDATLRGYRGLTPEQGEKRILSLARRCQRVDGVFSLLWHNSSLQGEWIPWANMYRRILPRLLTEEIT